MYYLLEIVKGDEKVAGKAVYEYETKNEALAAYHKKIGTAMSSELYLSQLCFVVNDAGGIDASNSYVIEGSIEPEPTTKTAE